MVRISETEGIHFPANVWSGDEVKEWIDSELGFDKVNRIVVGEGFISVVLEEPIRAGRLLEN